MFSGIPARSHIHLLRLAGILRLANALTDGAQGSDMQLHVAHQDGVILIAAQSVVAQIDAVGERIAGAKYLLEASCGMAVKLQSLPIPKQARARE